MKKTNLFSNNLTRKHINKLPKKVKSKKNIKKRSHYLSKHFSISKGTLKKNFRSVFSQIWINHKNKPTFPELELKSGPLIRTYNPEGVSLAFGAGGRRSYSGFIGFIRGLYKIKINNSNAFETAQFASAVSGSSWLLGTYTFAHQNIDKDTLLGKSILPTKITNHTLSNTNFKDNKNKFFLGSRLVNADIQKFIVEGHDKGIHPEYIWNYGIGQLFLKPYGLDNKIMALNTIDSTKIHKLTGEQPIVPSENCPFLIGNCSLLNLKNDVRGVTMFQVTPYYSGIINTICNNTKTYGFSNTKMDSCVGGVFQSTYSVGSAPYSNKNKDTVEKLQLPLYQDRFFTLDSMIGISGSSQAEKFSYISKNIMPSYYLWSPHHNDSTLVPIGDGAYCDVSGITSLLSRNSKHVISFLSCGNDINVDASVTSYADFCQLNLLNLFGLYDEKMCSNSKPNFHQSNDMQVFQKSDWDEFAQNLLDTKKNGGPVYSRKRLYVIPNNLLGITGNYYVDLLVIVVQTSTIFNSLLPQNITSTFNDLSGPFPNFPNYPMTSTNLSSLMAITKEQINLLSSYCEWCILHPPLKKIIQQMYKEAKI